MDLICRWKDPGGRGVYEDEKHWVVINAKGKETDRIEKEHRMAWPLSLVLKFDWEPVNHKRLQELDEELGRRLDAAKRNEK